MSEKPPYIPSPPPPDEINNSDLSGNKTFINGMMMLLAVIGVLWVSARFIPSVLVSLTPTYVETEIGKALSKHPLLRGGSKSEQLKNILTKLNDYDPELEITSITETTHSMENAFATLDKRILVTSELRMKSESEIALAFVIGHEMGHIKYRHPLKSFYQSFLMQFLMSLMGSGDSFTKLSGKFAASSFSRAQESQADRYGLELVHKAYGSIDGAFDFFNRMKKHDKRISLLTGSFLASHPLSEKRIETLTEFARKKGWPVKVDMK